MKEGTETPEVISINFVKHSTGVTASFFYERVIDIWNKLPNGVDSSAVKVFERSIQNTDFTTFNVISKFTNG